MTFKRSKRFVTTSKRDQAEPNEEEGKSENYGDMLTMLGSGEILQGERSDQLGNILPLEREV